MIEIRPMELDDLEAVMEIENSMFRQPWSETGFFSFLLRSDVLFLVAEEQEQIIGFCGAQIAVDESDVLQVAVCKERQHQGIGNLLMDQLKTSLTEAGVIRIFLEVRAGNQAAIRLYEKQGFEQIGIRKNYYEEFQEDGLVMRWEKGL